MAASGRETGALFRDVERKLRLAYRYVRRSRRLTRRLGALAATFPVRDERSLRYYAPRFADLGPDRAWIGDALGRVDEDDTFWDVGTRWGAYTAYLGRVCDRTATLAASTRGPHLRRVVAANGVDGTVVTPPVGADDPDPAAALGDVVRPTVARVATPEALDAVLAEPGVRLVYVTPAGRPDATWSQETTDGTADRLRAADFRVTRLDDGALRGERRV